MNNIITMRDIIEFVNTNHKDFHISPIKISDIVFERRNELLCFYCARYNNKWTCPPRIPKCDYKALFAEYDNAAFIYRETAVDGHYEDSRNESTVQLHKVLLDAEAFLLKNDNSTRVSFIGGSCKLCKNGCAPDKCSNPYQARIPLEATGVNVIKSAVKVGIKITFPATEIIIRLGLLLW